MFVRRARACMIHARACINMHAWPRPRTCTRVMLDEREFGGKIYRCRICKFTMDGSSVNDADDIVLKVKRLSEMAFLPTRGSTHAAGYDLYR